MQNVQDAANWAKVYYYGDYKTAIKSIDTNFNGFHIVTRVNYSTAKLWLEWRNKLVENNDKFMKLGNKPNWLVMSRAFRKSETKKIK